MGFQCAQAKTDWVHLKCTQIVFCLGSMIKFTMFLSCDQSTKYIIGTFQMFGTYLMWSAWVQNVPNPWNWVHWGHMTGYIPDVINMSSRSKLNSHLWAHWSYLLPVITMCSACTQQINDPLPPVRATQWPTQIVLGLEPLVLKGRTSDLGTWVKGKGVG